jgi:hypothetical protein
MRRETQLGPSENVRGRNRKWRVHTSLNRLIRQELYRPLSATELHRDTRTYPNMKLTVPVSMAQTEFR